MLQVVSRAAVISNATDSSSEVPDCQGLGNSAVLGQLPEVLPASVMHHQALQQLQMQLLPFQVIIVWPLRLRVSLTLSVNVTVYRSWKACSKALPCWLT